MADEIKKYVDFKRGTQAEYNAAKEAGSLSGDTLYFITDNGAIYLGEKLVADSKGLSNVEFVDGKITFTLEDGSAKELSIQDLLALGTAADEDKIVIIDAAGNVSISDVTLTDVTTDIANLKGVYKGVIEWGADSDINTYTEQGVYHFTGKRLNAADNLPITNVSNGKNGQVAFALINEVQLGEMDGSTSYKGILAQTLFLGNRQGGETKIYTRCVYITNDSPARYEYGVWMEVLQTQTLQITNLNELDNVTNIGLYTGVYTGAGESPLAAGSVFKLEVINNYAVVGGDTKSILQKMTVVNPDGTSKELQRTYTGGAWGAWMEVTDDDKQDLVTGAVEDNVATFDNKGQVKDSGKKVGTDQFEDVEDTSVQYALAKIPGDFTDTEYYSDSANLLLTVGTTKVYVDKYQHELFGTVTSDYSSGNYGVTKVDGSVVRMYVNGTGYYKLSKSSNVIATELGVVNYVDPKIAELNTKITEIEGAGLDQKADKVTSAVAGNLAGLDENGNLTDSGVKVGGESLAVTTDSHTLATEKAVEQAIANITVSVDSNDKVLSMSDDNVISSTISMTYDSTAKEIKLFGKDAATPISTIDATDFIKDGMVESASVVYCVIGPDGSHTEVTKETEGAFPCLKIVFNTDAGKESIHIALSDLVDVYTAGDGLNLVDFKFSVVIDPASEAFLTVGADGVKLSGVQTAIDTAKTEAIEAAEAAVETAKTTIDGYTVNGKEISSNPVLGSEDISRPAGKTVEESLTDLETATTTGVDDKIKTAIEGLDSEETSTDGTNVNVKVTLTDGKVTAVNVTDNTQTAIDTAKSEANTYTDERVEAARLVWGTIA